MSPLQDNGRQQQQEQLSLPNVQLQLVGSHQAGNVQTAVAAALLLRQRGWVSISAEAIAAGLQQAWLPGRFQVSSEQPHQPYPLSDDAYCLRYVYLLYMHTCVNTSAH